MGLVPKFCESNPDTPFNERVADIRNWPDSECTPLWQLVLMGEAQEASCSFPVSETQSDSSVKPVKNIRVGTRRLQAEIHNVGKVW